MRIEDELAAVMRAHDHEAPGYGGLHPPRPRPVQRWLPLAAAVAVSLAVLGTVLGVRAVGHAGSDSSACPGVYRSHETGNGWVPALPPRGVARDRLTPSIAPGAVTVCAYLGDQSDPSLNGPVAFAGARALTGDLAAVARTLTFEPRTRRNSAAVCQQYLASSDRDDFLIALHYPSGTVWVAAPGNHCAGATNGVFSTSTNLRRIAAASYQARRWIAHPDTDQPDPAQPATCPTQYRTGQAALLDGWVPGNPPRILTAGGLAPSVTPGAVTICSYLPPSQSSGSATSSRVALTDHRTLAGDLAPVADTLSREPRRLPDVSAACATYLAPTDGDNYLIGLAYPTGTVWVAAPGNHCEGATNGVFHTTANLRAIAAASLAARHWVAQPAPENLGGTKKPADGPCERGSAGRLGQDTSMVPAGVTSLDICVGEGNADGTAVTPHHVSAAGAAALVRALNALPTRPSTNGCLPSDPSARLTIYRLYFHYRLGPDVDVYVTVGCNPAINNNTLQARVSGSVIPMVEALAR